MIRRPPAARVGGIDGCRAGWVLVTLPPRGRARATVELLPTIATVVARLARGDLCCAGVDMPIGLPDRGPRACDVEARSRLGPRRSSVFPCPPRGLLGTGTYDAALARARAIEGKGLSRQAFNLLPRIAELDTVMTPALQARVFECHPEVCFAGIAGAPLDTPKRTAAGRAARRDLLRPAVPDIDDLLAARPRGAATDDVLDAAVVALTARRWHDGNAEVLGDGARDGRGLRMEIVC